MVHIDDLPLLVNAQVVLGIFFSCVIYQAFYFTLTISHLFIYFVFFDKFHQESFVSGFVGIWGQYESKIMGGFLGLFNEVLGSTSNSFRGIVSFFYEGLCPICFSSELGFHGFVFML